VEKLIANNKLKHVGSLYSDRFFLVQSKDSR